MEEFLYAQIDTNNIVVGISSLGNAVTASDLIAITQQQYTDEILGWLYNPATKTFTPPPPKPNYATAPTVTTIGISQQISELQASLVIAGTIENVPSDTWHDRYMVDMVSQPTLNKLVAADILVDSEVQTWFEEHFNKYGYYQSAEKSHSVKNGVF